MRAKQNLFTSSQKSFIDCIPASSDDSRLRLCQKRQEHRKEKISSLKRANKGWKQTSRDLTLIWKKLSHKVNATALKQLSDIRKSELGMYSALEIKWIHKNYRILARNSKLGKLVQEEDNTFCLSSNSCFPEVPLLGD